MSRAGSPAPAGRDAEVWALLRGSMLDLVCEHGYRSVTVEAICADAGVGVDWFERVFPGKQEAFVRLFDEEADRFIAAMRVDCEREASWRDGMRAAAYTGARWLRDHPKEARFCILETLSAGEALQLRREATLRKLAQHVDRGRQLLENPNAVSPAFAGAIVGAISEILVRRLAEGRELAEVVDLVPEVMYIAIRPYVDGEEALEELSIPAVPE
jgi:AcrR family transcriptional regulator